HGQHGSLENGHAGVVGDGEHGVGQVLAAAHHDAGDALAAEFGKALFGVVQAEVAQVGALRQADDLDAVQGEVFVESGEGQAGAVDGGFEDLAFVAAAAPDQRHGEVVGVAAEEVSDLQSGSVGGGR